MTAYPPISAKWVNLRDSTRLQFTTIRLEVGPAHRFNVAINRSCSGFQPRTGGRFPPLNKRCLPLYEADISGYGGRIAFA
jgi:hypothetical protein